MAVAPLYNLRPPLLEGAATGLAKFSVLTEKRSLNIKGKKKEWSISRLERGTLIVKVAAQGLRFGGGEKPPDSRF